MNVTDAWVAQNHASDLGTGTKRAWVIGIMVAVTMVKFLLMLLCRMFKNEIVRAYAQDHFFDVITNSIGLAAALLAQYFAWWLDPTGAIVVRNKVTLVDAWLPLILS